MQNKNEEKGLIFHIIHGSFVDGHGIRTTVFLKGCPLRCLWCCNPEGQHAFPELKVTASNCSLCGRCLKVCELKAIELNENNPDEKIRVNREICNNCLKCVDVCYYGALERWGTYYTVGELFDIVKRDEQFYRSSGGGVTLGGGEPTMQYKFVREFLQKCRENYIHTALDTCGYTVSEESVRALEEADLILFDIKGIELSQHIINTSVSNERILSNLKHLNDIGKPIIVRMPIIPGYNDSRENMIQAAELLAKLKSIERVDLLAYHQYGTIKYGQLGRCYGLNISPPDDAYMNQLKSLLEKYGLKVQLGG